MARKLINSQESLNISTHNAKMEGIKSLSTFKGFNEVCKKLAENKESICAHCYVDNTIKRYSSEKNGNRLENALIDNHKILTSRLLKKDEIIALGLFNELYFRFEAFGDLNNEIQLRNYLNIAKYYKNTQFALFTKHYNIIAKYLNNGGKIPSNVNLVLSGIFLNNYFNTRIVEYIKKLHKNTITFVVFDEETAQENGIKFNCQKQCNTCLNCYKKGKKFDVVEKLK